MINEPENTGEKQDGRFIKGQSGNPNGRPKGSLNNTTRIAMTLLDSETEAITQKAIELALGGDIQAIKLILERAIPARKERLINIDLPKINGSTDISEANKRILEAVSNGELTISEGEKLMSFMQVMKQGIKESASEQAFGGFW